MNVNGVNSATTVLGSTEFKIYAVKLNVLGESPSAKSSRLSVLIVNPLSLKKNGAPLESVISVSPPPVVSDSFQTV